MKIFFKDQNTKYFIFYDYETFGLDTALDKACQFAGIMTDINFNIIKKPLVLYCKPPQDYLPNPESILINGITPQETIKKGYCEAKFAKNISKFINQPNTCVLGFNNLKFDDEITRNIFYRNFLDPYSWSWKNYNSRWDIINIIKACYVLRPKGILWSKNKKNKPIFNLESLTTSNNLIHKSKHSALSDVYATISLAKLIKKKQPKLFLYLFYQRTKKQIIELINKNFFSIPFLYIDNTSSVVLPLYLMPPNNNILISYNIINDIDPLFYKIDKLIDFLKNKNKNNFIKFIYINRCPVLIPLNHLNNYEIKKNNINLEKCNINLLIIKKNFLDIKKKISFIFSKNLIFKKIKYSNDVDTQLYKRFFNNLDQLKILKIRNTKVNDLSLLKFKFDDDRINDLFFRYKGRNFPEILSDKEKILWLQHCRSKISLDKINKYLEKINHLSFLYLKEKPKLIKLKKYIYKIKNTIHY